MAPENKAAWLPVAKAHPMTVGPAEYPTAKDDEVIVRVAAVAVNPMDWYIQLLGEQLFSWLQYPYIGGTDVAGTVVELGSKVTKYKVGDRIMGLAAGFVPREGAFQNYTVLATNVSTPIPADLAFEDAVVLPLGVSTAASGLFEKEYLALAYPNVNPKPTGQTLLVWAGASSVGSNAIQLAVAAGYEVFTTASPKNWDYCKSLGAARVFDYHSPTVVDEIVAAFSGKTSAGGLSIQPGAEKHVFEIIQKVAGNKFVAVAAPVQDVPAGIKVKSIFGGSLKNNEVGGKVFDDFLPAALAQHKYKCVPSKLVVGEGLDKIQEALDKGKAGNTSVQKLVVKL